MNRRLRIALAQLNLWVGDLDGNADKVIEAARTARDEHGADLVAFPELCIIGYPPDDLLLRTRMPERIEEVMQRIRASVDGIHMVVGYPEYTDDGILYNSAAVFRDGELVAGYRKQHLANYGVFDEERHFRVGDSPCIIDVNGVNIGITICEDCWYPGPPSQAREAGAQLLININASPFHDTKSEGRKHELSSRVHETGLSICYINCVGGQDELVFDGDSSVFNSDGERIFQAAPFEEGVYSVDFNDSGEPMPLDESPVESAIEAVIYRGLTQAIRDYVDRNGFPGVLVGLSGGIDSGMTLALACDALGPDRVWAVSMPSRYTADMSKDDAREQAELLGARFDEIVIEDIFSAYLDTLAPQFEDTETDITEENLQSRIRGALLMALSNKFGHLVLATGNKSEMAVGYATLYGDMCGGFAPLKDVYKTVVYRLARYRNGQSPAIPERVIEREPSAELRPDQQDSDSLPVYEVLDPVIIAYVEDSLSIDDIVEMGYEEDMVRKVAGMIRRSEYKRRQAAPGPKITRRAFGRDRRYPITAVYGDL